MKANKIIIILLSILAILAVVIVGMLAKRTLREEQVSDADVVLQDQQNGEVPVQPLVPAPAKPASKPDPVIAFLKTLVAKYPNGSISECSFNGGRQFAVYPNVGVSDLDTIAFDSNGEELGSCGGYRPQQDMTTGEQYCGAVVRSCHTRIYYPAGGDPATKPVDTYNLK